MFQSSNIWVFGHTLVSLSVPLNGGVESPIQGGSSLPSWFTGWSASYTSVTAGGWTYYRGSVVETRSGTAGGISGSKTGYGIYREQGGTTTTSRTTSFNTTTTFNTSWSTLASRTTSQVTSKSTTTTWATSRATTTSYTTSTSWTTSWTTTFNTSQATTTTWTTSYTTSYNTSRITDFYL